MNIHTHTQQVYTCCQSLWKVEKEKILVSDHGYKRSLRTHSRALGSQVLAMRMGRGLRFTSRRQQGSTTLGMDGGFRIDGIRWWLRERETE